MHFVEVAVQNVRGFSPAGRFALKTGYLVLKPPTAELSPLAGLSLALLYADGRGGDAALAATTQKAGKAALTLVGQDSVTYRVLRELGGGGSLHRLNPATKQPELVSQDTAEANQFLRGQVGLPPRTTFEQLFCLQAAQLPSRRPRGAGRPASTSGLRAHSSPGMHPSSPGMPAMRSPTSPGMHPSSPGMSISSPGVLPASDIPAAEAKVRELEKELVFCREVDNLQFEVDGLNSQVFDLESKLRGTDGLKEKLRQAEEAWNAEPTPESMGLPQDIVARAERYPRTLARRDEAMARLQSEREVADEEAQRLPDVEPLVRNRNFWIAVGVGVACFVAGLFPKDWVRYVALLDIPAFGFAAVLAIRYVDELQDKDRLSRRGEMFTVREKKILEEFEAEAGPVRKALEVFDVDTPKDIPPRLQRREQLGAEVAQLRAQLVSMEKHPEFMEAAHQLPVLRQQIELLNAKISEKGAFVRDVREVERELARLKESIALARNPQMAAMGMPGADVAGGSMEPLEDPAPMVLSLAGDLLATDVPAVIGMMRERCVQYFSALTERRYASVEWDRDGRTMVVTSSGRRMPVGELPPREVDLFFLSLRLTVVEKVSARVKLPLLVEDALVGLDESRLPLLGRMLKHLGTLTQVLHVTPHPGLAQLSDGPVNL
ncbi:ATP-binding protein [Archangium lansingense]|uniref:Chromosome segregation protein SMC n=1 Tax=Archangium lansingense TaxID=2995310 RepID=A0ABT4ABI5_9BACT|nr:chromosome segregation protein SMC [Archangium lansinium]MCY1078589.1 chromosome segregation protein SMC [Archangium lansinium]